jgi:hypothetical protein
MSINLVLKEKCYHMSELILLSKEMAGKYRYVTSLDELRGILNDK